MHTHHQDPQGSPQWHANRCGLLTASNIADLFTAKGKIADNATARGLFKRLAIERITGRPVPTVETWEMKRGKVLEPIARELYAHHTGNPVVECGFFTRQTPAGTIIGASPDGLLGDRSTIEIKSVILETQFETIMDGSIPEKHLWQIQTQLWCSEREWCDFISYCPGMPLFIHPEMAQVDIAARIIEAADRCELEVRKLVEQFKAVSAEMPMTDWINEDEPEDA